MRRPCDPHILRPARNSCSMTAMRPYSDQELQVLHRAVEQFGPVHPLTGAECNQFDATFGPPRPDSSASLKVGESGLLPPRMFFA